MNDFDKDTIEVYKGGRFVGYVKSVSYSKGTFTITRNKRDAKKYATTKTTLKDIYMLEQFKYSIENGYGFNF